jgi:hypothetical protein
VDVVLTKSRILFLCAIALLFVVRPTASGQQSEEIIPFQTIVKYVFAGPAEQGTAVLYVVTDKREWKKIWKLTHLRFPERPPLPGIDFTSRMVLAVFHEYTGGSCTTSITNIVKTEDGLKVYVKETCPGPTCGAQPANVSKPLEIVETERVDKRTRKHDPELIVDLQFIECKPQG